MFIRFSFVISFLSFHFFQASVQGVPQLLRDDCHNKTILDFIVNENLSPTINFDNNGSNFNILANLLAAGNNEGVLNVSAPGGITFFAPNDDAIVHTTQDLGFEGRDEYKAYEFLISYLSKIYENPIEYIFSMPLYHIVTPGMNSTKIMEKTSFATWDSRLLLERIGLRLVDQNPELPDAELVPEMLNICTLNGYIHVVDRVLFAGPLAQPEEPSKTQEEEEPSLEPSEQPLYSPEEEGLIAVEDALLPTAQSELHEYEDTASKEQLPISSPSHSADVGPVDKSKTTSGQSSAPSRLPLPSIEIPYSNGSTETHSSEFYDNREPTPQSSPILTLEESANFTPLPHETINYQGSLAPLDESMNPLPSPLLSWEEPVPSSYIPERTIQPSNLPIPQETHSSISESSNPFEPDPSTLDLFPFPHGSGPNYEERSTFPLQSFDSNAGPILTSPESTDTIEIDLPEGSPERSVALDSEASPNPQELSEVSGVSNTDSCFPRNAIVHLSIGKDIEVQDLQAGHRVLSCESKSSVIYMFSHRTPSGLHMFLRIESVDNHTIELSPEHYIYANGRLVDAQNVNVGDRLRTLDGPSKVFKISKVHRPGLYAPHTLHGDIVVGRIVASTYTNALPYWVAHPALEILRLPVRLGMTKEPIGSLLYNGCPKWRAIRKWLF
ncbi:unnamed protein product [Agarophyton chilense]